MPKTLNRVWVHAVWSTKLREPLIKRYFRGEVNTFIKQHGARWGIQIDTVNGMPDHVHALMKIPTTMPISEVIKKLKGASSKWIKDNYFPSGKFEWQQGYGVFSVSSHEILKIRKYIYNQEKHHAEQSYSEEVKLLSVKNNAVL